MITASIRSEPAFGATVVGLIIVFGPLIAQRVRLPGLVGLLVGGALIGPNMLDVLESTVVLEEIGDIGVLYLLFLAGLNLDMKTVQQYRSVTLTFGLLTATFPWVLGAIVASVEGFDGRTALLIGSFWASYTLVAYNVIPRFGLERNPSMAATVGASSITDTIGLIALAVIVGLETGDEGAGVILLKVFAGLVVVGVYAFGVLPALTRWFFASLGQERELRFVIVLVGFTSAAVVAEAVGIEALIGAFFAGLGLNRLIPNGSQLMARTDFFGNALFIPAFLISVGLLVDPSVMFAGETVRLALLLGAALLLGKGAAAVVTGRIAGFSSMEVGLMFSLSSAQAAATLASTIIGLEAGLYGDEVVNAVMLVIVISLCVSGLGSDYFAPRVEPAGADERRLGESVVVPVAHLEGFDDAVWLAGRISGPDGGVIRPLTVARIDQPDAVEAGRERLDEMRSIIRGLGLTGDPELRVERSLVGGVERYTLETDASLMLMPWPGRTDFRGYMFGTSSDELAAAPHCPIAAVSLANREMERVLIHVPDTDLTPGRRGDVLRAIEIARNVAEAQRIPLVFGPADRDRLADHDLELPDAALPAASGGDDARSWVEQHAGPSDLCVLAGGSDPFRLIGHLSSRGFSTVVAINHRRTGQYSPDGSIGVVGQQRTTRT